MTQDISFDLVVATVGRTVELDAFLGGVAAQQYARVRVIAVDQNDDDRVAGVLRRHPELELLHLRAPLGASRARNVGLGNVEADVVGVPDDDCVYPPGTLASVANTLAAQTSWDGLVGRLADPSGRTGRVRSDEVGQRLDRDNAWRFASAITLFLRRSALDMIGPWDESIGPGAGTRWDTGEDTDWLIRAVLGGLELHYEPSIEVLHHDPFLDLDEEAFHLAYRYGIGTSYLLRKHGYGRSAVARYLARSALGATRGLVRRDVALARLHLAILRGRLVGAVG